MVVKTAENRETQNKPRRVPVSGLRDILTVHGKDPDKVYRFVKDAEEGGSRIMQFKRAGYEFTDGSNNGTITVGEECVYKSRKSNGTIVRHPVEANKHGAPQYLYLMEIKKEWYDEDQAKKAEAVDELERTITAKQNPDSNELGQYGTVKINR
jgi:hypothetical protein